MMCHKIGRPPMGIIGLGTSASTSRIRVPNPPQRITTCTALSKARAGKRGGTQADCAGYTPRWRNGSTEVFPKGATLEKMGSLATSATTLVCRTRPYQIAALARVPTRQQRPTMPVTPSLLTFKRTAMIPPRLNRLCPPFSDSLAPRPIRPAKSFRIAD